MKPVLKGLHRHHVIPIHAGGTDDDDNIVYLTVDEHIQAHLDLYEKYGKEADQDAASLLLACKYRANDEVKMENYKRSCARGGKGAHKVKLENGFYDRLGKHNSKVLSGRNRPDLAAIKSKEWAEKKWKWYNNGIEDRRFTEQPEGWFSGRLFTPSIEENTRKSVLMSTLKWWNNGTVRVRRADCPGPEWKLGRKIEEQDEE